MGYTSTSLNPLAAKKFAFDDLRDNKIPVIFEMDSRGSIGLFELTKGYSAYPSEAEVLVQDGLKYLITAITQ